LRKSGAFITGITHCYICPQRVNLSSANAHLLERNLAIA